MTEAFINECGLIQRASKHKESRLCSSYQPSLGDNNIITMVDVKKAIWLNMFISFGKKDIKKDGNHTNDVSFLFFLPAV